VFLADAFNALNLEIGSPVVIGIYNGVAEKLYSPVLLLNPTSADISLERVKTCCAMPGFGPGISAEASMALTCSTAVE
jgi:hypothetical protein